MQCLAVCVSSSQHSLAPDSLLLLTRDGFEGFLGCIQATMDGNQEEIKRMESKRMQDDGWKLYGEIVRRRDGDSEDSEVPSSKTCSLKGDLRVSPLKICKKRSLVNGVVIEAA
ncbi:hypothetical protein B9Z55_026640 [Caenorhabditis nigoni]|uniref:Uncharacterized protein n=1 Tax=Caenorhabditis nigoni TaxID=1611254 RepID=A0A2G5T456_9PELO|nr:hypothetical protein B9Z55_026640 [Caenorhabditis nigoni]